ncbi:MAG TPA: PqiC family protein [Dongiaceae bacterium]|nr:PqiC family protein [Dongiaceae bacterium]
MTHSRQCFVLAAFWLTALLVGCASPDPKLYTIAAVASAGADQASAMTKRIDGANVVVLRQIGLARYLERPQIVRSSENYQVDVLANDWWGEPLAAMLSRVLVEELGQHLPESVVLGESGAVSAAPDTVVELNISRLDLDAAGNLILYAQASVSSKAQDKPALESFRFSVRPSAPGVQAQVAAISVAVGQLADKLAPIIQAQAARR